MRLLMEQLQLVLEASYLLLDNKLMKLFKTSYQLSVSPGSVLHLCFDSHSDGKFISPSVFQIDVLAVGWANWREQWSADAKNLRVKVFFASGSVALYVFLYSINYLVFDLKSLSGPATLYPGYSLIMATAIMLSTGTIGFLMCFYFVHYLFSSVKID